MGFELDRQSAGDSGLDTSSKSDVVDLIEGYLEKQRTSSPDAKLNAAKIFIEKPFEIRNALDTDNDNLVSQDEIKDGIKRSSKSELLPGLKIMEEHFDNIKGITDRGRLTEASGISAQDIIVLGHVAKTRILQERNFNSARDFASKNFQVLDINGDNRVSYAEFSQQKLKNGTESDGAKALESVFGKVASGKVDGRLAPDSSFSLKDIMEFNVSNDHRKSMAKGIYEFASRPYPNQDLTNGVGLVVGTVTGLVMGATLPLSVVGGVLGVGLVRGIDYLSDNIASYRRVNRLENEVLPAFLDK